MVGLVIGIWPNAITTEIEAILSPAAKLDGGTIERGPGWHIWTVHDGPRLIGAANVRRCVDRSIDVVLVGGVDSRRWITALDEKIGRWAVAEGAERMTARGRKGWIPALTKQGWNAVTKDHYAEYEREL